MNYLNKTRNENKMKFFADFIVQCLTLLRKEHIIYKDLHYANIVLMYLYISLIDFHISMEYKNKNQNLENHHFLGARRLCPPEMEKGFVYDFNSDYYRLGSMLYFLLFNKYPNDVKKKKNISDITINFNETKNYSYSFIDFINKLIVNDFHKRIGFNNIEELKNHELYKSFNWSQLIDGKIISPFEKIKRDNLGLCNYHHKFNKIFFIRTNNLGNRTFKNILFTYYNINNYIASDIYNSIINSIDIK